VLDRCEFEENAALHPVELRRTIFTRTAATRCQAEHPVLDREAIVALVAAEHGVSSADIENAFLPT